MDNDFDNVSWQNESNLTPKSPDRDDSGSRPGASGKNRVDDTPQAGHDADAVDLGGIGFGRLDCTVDTPLKEGDGTKDAYISYLVSTHVRASSSSELLAAQFC
jgi:sorting nexin-4